MTRFTSDGITVSLEVCVGPGAHGGATTVPERGKSITGDGIVGLRVFHDWQELFVRAAGLFESRRASFAADSDPADSEFWA